MARFAAAALALLLQPAPVPEPVSPPEPPAEVVAERVVPFTPGKTVPLNLEVGPVRLRRVTFDVSSAEDPDSSILGVLQGEDAATSSNLRARFDVEGEPPEPWVAEVRIELLDRRGRRSTASARARRWRRAWKRCTWTGGSWPTCCPTCAPRASTSRRGARLTGGS